MPGPGAPEQREETTVHRQNPARRHRVSAEINHSHHNIVKQICANISHEVLTEGEMPLLVLIYGRKKYSFVDRFHISDSKELGRGLKGRLIQSVFCWAGDRLFAGQVSSGKISSAD